MPPVDPNNARSPKSRIDKVRVIHNGTLPPNNHFSIAKLLLKNGKIVLGVRYDISDWSVDPDKGYPTVRGGHASWFILPKGFHKVFCDLTDDELNCDSF